MSLRKTLQLFSKLPDELQEIVAEYVDWLYGSYVAVHTHDYVKRRKPRPGLDVIVFPFYKYLTKTDEEPGFAFSRATIPGVNHNGNNISKYNDLV